MSLRDAMPQTAEFIDFAREVFGKDAVNTAIRKGIGGLPGYFHASEGGQEAGTPIHAPGASFPVGELWFSAIKKER